MHRSGTSLTSSILSKAGLDIGENLIGAGIGNKEGHFENHDFHEFQCKVLSESGFHKDGWDNQVIPFLKQYKEEAESIISKNESIIWGWKDPRTCLFLNFWDALIPDANYLFVYRSPWEVIDSLYRRGNDDEIKVNYQSAIDSWLEYNKLILEFYRKNRGRSLLVNIRQVMADTSLFLSEINKKFDMGLNVNIESPFKRKIFIEKEGLAILINLFPKLKELYVDLEKESSSSEGMVQELDLLKLKGLVVELWGEARFHTAKFEQLEGELARLNKIEKALNECIIDKEQLLRISNETINQTKLELRISTDTINSIKQELVVFKEMLKSKDYELLLAMERIKELELKFFFRVKRRIKQLFYR